MKSIRPNGPCRVRRTCRGTRSRRSWRSTRRPSSCGGSRTTRPGYGPSRRTPSPTYSPSTWGPPPVFYRMRPSGGTRARPGRWWPSGGRPRSGRWPCNGRRSSLPHGSGSPCRGWSSSARRVAPPGPTPQASRPTDPEQHLFRAPAFNVFGDGWVCPGSHKFPEEVGLIPESFFSLTGDTRDRSKKHTDNLQALWEELDGTTAYPIEDLVPQCTVAHAMAVSEGRRSYR